MPCHFPTSFCVQNLQLGSEWHNTPFVLGFSQVPFDVDFAGRRIPVRVSGGDPIFALDLRVVFLAPMERSTKKANLLWWHMIFLNFELLNLHSCCSWYSFVNLSYVMFQDMLLETWSNVWLCLPTNQWNFQNSLSRMAVMKSCQGKGSCVQWSTDFQDWQKSTASAHRLWKMEHQERYRFEMLRRFRVQCALCSVQWAPSRIKESQLRVALMCCISATFVPWITKAVLASTRRSLSPARVRYMMEFLGLHWLIDSISSQDQDAAFCCAVLCTHLWAVSIFVGCQSLARAVNWHLPAEGWRQGAMVINARHSRMAWCGMNPLHFQQSSSILQHPVTDWLTDTDWCDIDVILESWPLVR